jgi:hypothetical protein
MKITVLDERGYEEALRGMSYSFHDRSVDVAAWWKEQFPKAARRAAKLAHMDGGHNKFLESITVWIDVEASRAWWSEMDTYRVGTTKQSESTMHTLAKRKPTPDDFEVGTSVFVIDAFIKVWEIAGGEINTLKMNLPEGFLQRRLICTNYKVLRNIIAQRENHRLHWWNLFCNEILFQVEHPEFLANTNE